MTKLINYRSQPRLAFQKNAPTPFGGFEDFFSELLDFPRWEGFIENGKLNNVGSNMNIDVFEKDGIVTIKADLPSGSEKKDIKVKEQEQQKGTQTNTKTLELENGGKTMTAIQKSKKTRRINATTCA